MAKFCSDPRAKLSSNVSRQSIRRDKPWIVIQAFQFMQGNAGECPTRDLFVASAAPSGADLPAIDPGCSNWWWNGFTKEQTRGSIIDCFFPVLWLESITASLLHCIDQVEPMSFVQVIHSTGWIVAFLQRMSTRNPRAQNPFNELWSALRKIDEAHALFTWWRAPRLPLFSSKKKKS